MGRVYAKRDTIVSRQIAGQALLIPVRGEMANLQRIFALNPVAEHIWNSLDGKKSEEDILDEILARFDAEAPRARKELQEFLGQLIEADLIEAV